MTRQENPLRLPQEIEFQARKNSLHGQISYLEENKLKQDQKYFDVYFLDGDEMLSISFRKDILSHVKEEDVDWEIEMSPYKNKEGRIYGVVVKDGKKTESITPFKRRTFYYPPRGFTIAGFSKNGELYAGDGKEIDSLDEINSLISVVLYMINAESSDFNNPLQPSAIPVGVRKNVKRVRESPQMRLEYAKPEFYRLLRKVQEKAGKVEKGKYASETGSLLTATTGWINIEKDGGFETRLDVEDMYLNGSWSPDIVSVSRRETGSMSWGIQIFSELDLWDGAYESQLRTLEQLQNAIDTLKLLDEAITHPPSN